jgi:hypothetical protein
LTPFGFEGWDFADEVNWSSVAIECLDFPRRAWELTQAVIDRILAVAPRLGPFQVERHDVCLVWPAEPDPPPPLTGSGAGPILVVGTTGDPATPLDSRRSATPDASTTASQTAATQPATAVRAGRPPRASRK